MAEHFFVIGGQRCATTYLYHQLDAHPQIEMARPMRPEPKFFLGEDACRKGRAHYEQRYFSASPAKRMRGEKSTSYMESELAAQRIAELIPQAAIVAVVREPVARAISHWRFSVQHGAETLGMAEAFYKEAERRDVFDRARFSVSPYAYLSRGCYADHLGIWERYFPAENILVVLYEELTARRKGIATIYEFLDVDPAYSPSGWQRRVNASESPDGGNVDLSVDLTRYLQDYFEIPNERLEKRLGRSLDQWRCKDGARR